MRSNTLLTQRNSSIYTDFESMFNMEGKRCDVIYQELSGKYFLHHETIAKIVMKEAKKKESNKAEVNKIQA